MTREEAINILDEIQSFDCNQYYKPYAEAFDLAISDMKRVEELETENKRLTDILAEQSKNLDSKNLYIEELEAENKRLKEDLSRWQEFVRKKYS